MKRDKMHLVTDVQKQFKEMYIPKSTNQQNYVDALNNDDNKMIVVTGPAGTGKTLFACKTAIELLLSGELNKIVITRPLVTVEEDLGFLPGNIIKKMDPWTRPVFDIFLEYYSRNELEKMLYENVIEISPLAFMRGRTFKNTFVIADEMQNSSPCQMQMLTTRIGKDSRLVITGDLNQSDRTYDNGLKDIVDRINKYYKNNPMINKMVKFIALETNDVQRSKLVKQVIDIYNYQPIEIKKIKPIDFDTLYKREENGDEVVPTNEMPKFSSFNNRSLREE
jgi:phosphate starvation-inducible PhoH-like protein